MQHILPSILIWAVPTLNKRAVTCVSRGNEINLKQECGTTCTPWREPWGRNKNFPPLQASACRVGFQMPIYRQLLLSTDGSAVPIQASVCFNSSLWEISSIHKIPE